MSREDVDHGFTMPACTSLRAQNVLRLRSLRQTCGRQAADLLDVQVHRRPMSSTTHHRGNPTAFFNIVWLGRCSSEAYAQVLEIADDTLLQQSTTRTLVMFSAQGRPSMNPEGGGAFLCLPKRLDRRGAQLGPLQIKPLPLMAAASKKIPGSRKSALLDCPGVANNNLGWHSIGAEAEGQQCCLGNVLWMNHGLRIQCVRPVAQPPFPRLSPASRSCEKACGNCA